MVTSDRNITDQKQPSGSSQHVLNIDWDINTIWGKLDLTRQTVLKNLVVHRKYVAVRGKMRFVQIFAHVTTVEIDPANLNQMYVPTNLLRMRVRMQWTMMNLIFVIIIRMMIFYLLELIDVLSDEEDDGDDVEDD